MTDPGYIAAEFARMIDDPEAADRVVAGLDRGRAQLETFHLAMAHELEANAHKGEPSETAALDHVRELIYHAMKLYMAILWGHAPAALEYAADCGNHAWMAAHAAGALDLDLLTEQLEGGSRGLYESASPKDADAGRSWDEDVERARLLRQSPWAFSSTDGGFYEALKGHAVKAAGELRALPKLERDATPAEHFWRVPRDGEALGHRPREIEEDRPQ